MTVEAPIWRTASPLWDAAREGDVGFERPAILRFAGDDFMDRFQAVLAAHGEGVAELVAADETWRDPRAGLAQGGAGEARVRLYQPVHARFYLVAASLVCPQYTLPDKRIDPLRGESASFLLRQLRAVGAGVPIDIDDPATFAEHSWIPEGTRGAWTPTPPGGLAAGEQRLPMFAQAFENGAGPRRVLAGLVPVSAREAYEAAPARLPAPGSAAGDPMGAITDTRLGSLAAVVAGLQSLRATIELANASPHGPPDQTVQEACLVALLELGDLIRAALPKVWAAASGLGSAHKAVLDRLSVPNGFRTGRTWLAALKEAAGPPSAAAGPPEIVAGMSRAAIDAAIGNLGVELDRPFGSPRYPPTGTTFFGLAAPALAAEPVPAQTSSTSSAPPAAAAPSTDDGFLYALRCVYERPNCPEPLRMRLSAPSRPFTLARFHEPDAPFRPTLIPTPIDVSLAGLRKSPKSVSVMISAQLRQQIERMEGIKLASLDSGDIPAAGAVSLGMVCQLSIPIITICALVLLMIIVQLLNIVFFWVPLFKICLPSVGSR
jgi:hypothetical protein